MFRVLVDDELFYFKNKSTLIDFLDDNLPSWEDSCFPNRQFHIKFE